MKIISHGVTKRIFQCSKCYCVFIANCNEFVKKFEDYGEYYYCICPECKSKAQEISNIDLEKFLRENSIQLF